MKLFLFVPLLLAVSCGVKKKSSYDYGKTTKADLIATEGEPIKEEKIPIDNGVVLHYADNVKYQIDGDVVSAGFKDPKGDQKTVLYWKHRFKDCATRVSQLSESAGSHIAPKVEMACDEEGIKVIYAKDSPFVTRVIEYAKK